MADELQLQRRLFGRHRFDIEGLQLDDSRAGFLFLDFLRRHDHRLGRLAAAHMRVVAHQLAAVLFDLTAEFVGDQID